MIAHVWGGRGASLTLDPVCGVRGDRVVTLKYNDFAHMKWLGNKPASAFPILATEESGYWVLVESRAKLNRSGKSDGINQLWIDAVFLEAYWNDGSPDTQSRCA
jgi:hypothetical protein